nr:uncharacterized protein LOC129261146 [Lytechinus pictus]
MASGFSTSELCEEEGCKRNSQLVCALSEKRRLCQPCASKKIAEEGEASWTCKKHAEPIKFFCVQHNVLLCQSCATVAHQKPCDLKDVEDAVKECKEKLKDVLPAVKDRIPVWHKHMKTVLETSSDIHVHFDNVESQIRAHFEHEKEIERNRSKEKDVAITEESERKIQIIHKQRDEELKRNVEDLQVREQELEKTLDSIVGEFNGIRKVVTEEMKEITERSKDVLERLDESLEGIEHVLLSDQELCVRARELLKTANDALHSDTGANSLQLVSTAAREVKFVKRQRENAVPIYRIDGFRGRWEVVDTVDIPKNVKLPSLVGCVGEGSAAIRDNRSGDLYLANLKTKAAEKIIESRPTHGAVVSCVSLDDKTTVCGKAMKGEFADCVSFYDADWKLIHRQETSRTEDPIGGTKRVFVDVDCTGMILAADFMASDVNIINPSNFKKDVEGSIVGTIPIKDKMSAEGFRSLSSGDIVVKSGYGGLSVLDRSGEVKNFIQDYEWGSTEFCVDSMTDALYVVYKDPEKMMYAVDQVRAESGVVFRKILEYPMSVSTKHTQTQRCTVTPSGIIIAFNGERLFLFKKSFTL